MVKMKNIVDVIKKMNDSNEEIIILKYENIFCRMFYTPVLLTGSILNFIFLYLLWKQDLKVTLSNSFFMLGIYLLFELVSKNINNEKFKSNIFSLLFSATLVYVVTRFYYLIGPTVWTISLILIIISMVRIKKNMLIIISLTIFLLGLYVWNLSYPFHMGTLYYVAQNVSFAILLTVTAIIHKINTNRYNRINKQFQQVESSERKIKQLAYHDHLTGLPNRLSLSEKLNRAILLSSRKENMLATMFLDLDDFKMINDTMGHDIGDQLLVEVSKRLVSTLRECDTVARIGGDEFIMLIEDVENVDYINRISEKIIKCFNEPFRFNNQECFITTSLGVAIYPNDGVNAEELIKNADVAMYKAKGKDKNQYAICTPVMKTKILEIMEMNNSLSEALKQNEFELYYQPQLSCISNEIVGLEALIRWNHPELGMGSPVEFIPIAEQTNLIISIGEWVLRTACMQNKMWQDAGLPRIRMGVNLSAKQFQNGNLVRDVKEILSKTGLDCQYLELEITESAVMKGKGSIIETLTIF